MPGPNSQVSIIDGTLDFSGGVNSIKVPTVQSERNRGGLARNENAWMVNGQVRDGGIRPRFGWLKLGNMMSLAAGRFQGCFLYRPDGADPYFVFSIEGRIYRTEPDNPEGYVDLSEQFSLTMPATEPHTYFVQAERFLVIQAGDNATLPLFWDGTTMRRSLGISGLGQSTVPPGNTPGVYTVTLLNGTAQPNKIVPAGSVTAEIGANSGAGIIYTGQVGAFVSQWTTPAIGASIVLQVTQDPTAALGKIVGISNSVGGPTITGSWTVTAINVPTTGVEPVEGVASELPAAGPMDYYMGRIWYAVGRTVTAGDIVKGDSGTIAYNFRDSVLKVTENPLAIGGDGFTVAADDGNIRAVKHSANIDAAMGQGRLYVFTRKAVYALQVPVTREDWIGADNNNQPLFTLVQLANGSVNDRSVVAVNGDLYYHSFEPGIRSLVTAVRYFNQPGNIEISANENRILRSEDRALLYAASGVFFNNRLLETASPVDTVNGVVFSAIVPLDFVPISSFMQQSPPVWEGMYQGLNILEIASADFSGLERAFALIVSAVDDNFQIWELTDYSRRDNIDSRITFRFESPAFTWGDEATLKRLISGELWVDQLSGIVNFTVEYRPDSDSCWHLWHVWEECNIANTCEDPEVEICYPTTPYPDSYRATMALPKPRAVCTAATGRPSDIGYQFQVRVTIKGWCRVRGLWLHATPFERSMYSRLTC